MGTRQSTTSEPVVLTRQYTEVSPPSPPQPSPAPPSLGTREPPSHRPRHRPGIGEVYPSTPPPRYDDIEHPLSLYQPTQDRSYLSRRPLPPIPPNERERQHQQRLANLDAIFAELGIQPPSRPSRPPSLTRTLHSTTQPDEYHRRPRLRTNPDLPPGSTPPFSIHDNPLLFLRELNRRKCIHCSEEVPFFEYQSHVSSCPKRLKMQYNEDILKEDNGECAICLEDLTKGDNIARLPCLCIYHIKCIEEWFRVKEICPQHPESKLLSL